MGLASVAARDTGSTGLLEYAAGTTVGACRNANEDAWGAFEAANAFVVVDGAGGGGARVSAANLTVGSFAQAFSSAHGLSALGKSSGSAGSVDPSLPRDLGPDPLALAILRANAQLLAAAEANHDLKGQAAAVCAARFVDRWVAVTHAGDCRVGCLRDGRFGWLTEDHSLVAELRKRSAPTEQLQKTAATHPNVITRAVGFAAELPVDVAYHPTRAGDLYLLCSDGVSRQVEPADLARLLGEGNLPLEGRCAALLEATEKAGGRDNATVVLVKLR
jgi:PPM family protein phosphatase